MNDEKQHLLECLARDILKRPLDGRRDFLKLFEKHNGHLAAATEKLKKIIKAEWEKKHNV